MMMSHGMAHISENGGDQINDEAAQQSPTPPHYTSYVDISLANVL